MALTARGEEVLPQVQALNRELHGLTELEEQLAGLLRVDRVCIVSGDADQDESVKVELGRTAAYRVRSLLHHGSTLAVTGGSTIAATAQAMQSQNPLRVMVVPARGGFGRAAVATQANTIAAQIAGKKGTRIISRFCILIASLVKHGKAGADGFGQGRGQQAHQQVGGYEAPHGAGGQRAGLVARVHKSFARRAVEGDDGLHEIEYIEQGTQRQCRQHHPHADAAAMKRRIA